jgi:hypothetical protein
LHAQTGPFAYWLNCGSKPYGSGWIDWERRQRPADSAAHPGGEPGTALPPRNRQPQEKAMRGVSRQFVDRLEQSADLLERVIVDQA